MYKRLIFVITFVFLITVTPRMSNAHLGNGPPFLKVDGKYALTNVYNQGQSSLTVGWDVPPDSYLINKPIHFEIDVPVLLQATTVPQEQAKDVKVRWSFASGENFENKNNEFVEGTKIDKTFKETGSFLVIIEAKLPADTDYIVIDTVQVDVKPNESYMLPSTYIYAGTQFDDPNKNVFLVSESSADTSTKIKSFLWDFGEGALSQGRTINRRFEKAREIGVEPVFHRVVDENGFVADVGFVVEKRENKLQFIPFSTNMHLPVTVGTYEQAGERAGSADNKLPIPVVIIISLAAIVGLGGVWVLILKRKK